MALKAVVDSLDEIPDGIRGEYEEHEGKFRLSVDGADALVDNSGIKTALEKERAKHKLTDAIRKEFPGATDDDIRELMKKAKAMKKGDGTEPPADNEKLVAKLRKEIEEEYAPDRAEKETLKAKLRTVLLDDQVKSVMLSAGVFPEDVDDLLKITRHRFDLNDKDKVVVLDADGDPSSVALEKYIKETLKKEKPKFYKAPDASGGGAGGARRPSDTRAEVDDLSKLPPADRLTEARKRGLVKKT